MADPLKTNLYGPGLVGANGVLSPQFVNFLLAVLAQATDTATTADAAAQAASEAASSSDITITGSNGVSVYGDAESGFSIVGPGTSSGPGVPLSIAEDTIYTVAANTQVLYHSPIDLDGELVVSGELIEVG